MVSGNRVYAELKRIKADRGIASSSSSSGDGDDTSNGGSLAIGVVSFSVIVVCALLVAISIVAIAVRQYRRQQANTAATTHGENSEIVLSVRGNDNGCNEKEQQDIGIDSLVGEPELGENPNYNFPLVAIQEAYCQEIPQKF